ncbi:MAG TPA: TonB-dependent receptor [Vicinamibacterales bacterium]|nr:TonB-dependent receptor [Vicinamibacterales bacterium]
MKRAFEVFAALAVLLAMAGASYGQGGTTSTLNGIVVDASGAVIPGANVTAKHTATGVTSDAVSNSEGVFSFPALNTGTYTVTVSLQGFKQYVANNVVLTSGAGAAVRAVLEVGAVEETVTVSSQSAIVQTQNSTISTTITTNQVIRLPVTSRSAMDFVAMMPGVATPNGNRQSTINGLPRGTINITLDGVNIQDNTLRSSDGFFAIVSPRLDAVEEVTLQTAAQGADSGGQGAVQVKFVTRSGTNDYVGSGYYYYRNDKLNANTWFNDRDGNAKPALLQNQIGGRLGGPIKRNKIFFFGNYEEFRQPSDQSRQRTLLNTQAQSGIYTYTSGGVTRSINVMQLAASNGFTSTVDPTVGKMLQDIRYSTGIAGGVTTIDANLDRLTFNNHVDTRNWFPTARLDVNLTNDHRFTSSFNYQKYNSFPDTLNNRDPSFPGFPAAAGQYSQRVSFSNWVRSTFGSNLVNEARIGYSGAPVEFFPEFTTSQFTGSLANSNGVLLSFPSVGSALQNPASSATPQSRNATAVLGEDSVTWLKGAHSITFGGSATQYTIWMKNQTLTPTANLGFANSDPAIAMFSAASFPGASTTQLGAAENLYGLLTGRIVSFAGEARIDETTSQYGYLGASMQRARMREMDAFIQDQWRVR